MADRRSRGEKRMERFYRAASESGSESGASRNNDLPIFRREAQDPAVAAEKQQLQTELRRQYSDLIETCQSYRDKDGIEPNLETVMTENIREGNRLFQRIGGGPGDMYMAFLHTKMCSGMILSKTEKIGSSSSGFTVEGFLNAIIEKSHNDIGEYSPLTAVSSIVAEASRGHKSLATLTVLLGSFDRNSILTPSEAKEKKPRATPRKKMDAEDGNATHHEEVRMTDAERESKNKDSPETQSKEILRILTANQKTKKAPSNLFEFTMDRESIANFFENLFYVSFLVRDGWVSIRRRKRRDGDSLRYDSDLLIAPEEPPRKQQGSNEEDSSTRSQHIISFNSRVYKELVAASYGPPTIKRGKKSTATKKK